MSSLSSSLSEAYLKIDYDIVDVYNKYHDQTMPSKSRGRPIPQYINPSVRLNQAAEMSATIHNAKGIRQTKIDYNTPIRDTNFDVNSLYNIDTGDMNRDTIVLFLREIGAKVQLTEPGSEGNIQNMTGFYALKIKGFDTPIPVRVNPEVNVTNSEKQDEIIFTLYKEAVDHNRTIDVPLDDIESITLVTLVTLRGLKRELKRMAKGIDNLSETSVAGFDASLI